MHVSPHERKVLASIEKQLRAEDSGLAAVLDRPSSPSSSTSAFPLSTRHVLLLLGALTGLIAVYTALAEKPGLPGLAAMTAVAVVPWIVAGAWSAERRSSAAAASDGGSDMRDGNKPGASGGTGPLRTKRRVLLAVVGGLVVLALVFPAWQPAVALALTLLAANFLPWLVVRVVERFERSSGPTPRRSARATEAGDGENRTGSRHQHHHRGGPL